MNKYLIEAVDHKPDLDKLMRVIKSVETEKQLAMAEKMVVAFKKKYKTINYRYDMWLDDLIEQQRFAVLRTDPSLGARR